VASVYRSPPRYQFATREFVADTVCKQSDDPLPRLFGKKYEVGGRRSSCGARTELASLRRTHTAFFPPKAQKQSHGRLLYIIIIAIITGRNRPGSTDSCG
jgi:hypothetical protein